MYRVILTVAMFAAVASPLAAGETMPMSEVRAITQKYCTVCHTDEKPLGGLSLEHVDRALVDPSIAAMMVSKLIGKAMGASGQKLPDRATQDAFREALTELSKGATQWGLVLTGTRESQAPMVAVIVKEIPTKANDEGAPDLYRLGIHCNPAAHEARFQLTWALRDITDNVVRLTVSADDSAPVQITIAKGDGSVFFNMPIPKQSLTVSGLFPDETVTYTFRDFPFRRALSSCFGTTAAH